MKTNSQRLIVLFCFFIILLTATAIKERLDFFSPQSITQPFKSIKTTEASAIEITIDNKTTSLYKKQNHWFQKHDKEEYQADENRINKILQNIKDLEKGEIYSTNKNKHREFGIDKQKITVKIPNQNIVIYVGNNAGIDKTYTRIDQSNEVFISTGLNGIFYPADFRDFAVYFINDESKVTSVEIKYDNFSAVLKKNNNNWTINNKNAKKDRVEFFLNDLSTLKAQDFNQENPKSNPELVIQVKENNMINNAEFFLPGNQDEKDKQIYYLRTSNSNKIFEIPAVYVSSLKKEEKDFIDE
ncbi:MAG: hypothetical protein UR15_C0018G0007 [Parcubacteria group bacterium GW2011_GWA2_31_28]|nr:MAG: hypothetical protein UR15_C0018G0007 [Parcubacteria group bacterium GW2011_GWA2_31_28]